MPTQHKHHFLHKRLSMNKVLAPLVATVDSRDRCPQLGAGGGARAAARWRGTGRAAEGGVQGARLSHADSTLSLDLFLLSSSFFHSHCFLFLMLLVLLRVLCFQLRLIFEDMRSDL